SPPPEPLQFGEPDEVAATPAAGAGRPGPATAGSGRRRPQATTATGSSAMASSQSTDAGARMSAPRAEEYWRTPADEGWSAAAAASQPQSAGQTQTGLPKRVPMAQLVPGGVDSAGHNSERRTPEGVRGLLSAYHRGVQRGRSQPRSENDPNNPQPSPAGQQ